MPFTLSHPAAVLPLLRDGRPRGPLVASALVAGSLAPDVPFFADSLVHGTFGYGTFTHSLWGIPTADVAIAAALVAGWHRLLREPLVALLPERWADAADALTAPVTRGRGTAGTRTTPAGRPRAAADPRTCPAGRAPGTAGTPTTPAGPADVPTTPQGVAPSAAGERTGSAGRAPDAGTLTAPAATAGPAPDSADARIARTTPAGRVPDAAAAGWFALSAAIGAATHVGWDAFTHGGRAGVRLLPVLDHTVHGRPVYSLLQYGCSALGLGVLAWYVPRALRRMPPAPVPPRRLRLPARTKLAVTALVGAAATAGAARRLARWSPETLRHADVFDLIPPVAFGGGTGAAVGLALYAAVARGLRRTG